MIKALALVLAAIVTMWGEPCSAQTVANQPSVLFPTARPGIGISVSDRQNFSDMLTMIRGKNFAIGTAVYENPRPALTDFYSFKEPIDVYIGLLGPDQSVRTWQPEGKEFLSRGILTPGILPYAKNFQAPANFSVETIFGEPIWYQFGLQEPTCFYSIFIWLVKAGAPIGDPRRWVGAATYPLLVVE